ncbi:MAG: hypothetical protein JNM09_04825 [Blastocatellia bacterium]|nr:hypothetical protein [Blastocatellia bacterium]
MEEDWPFDQEENVAAITTVHVLERRLPILRVRHYDDDHSWAFVCGTTNDVKDGQVIGMGEALEFDPTLRTIADLPPGWSAWRESVGGAWYRKKDDEDL